MEKITANTAPLKILNGRQVYTYEAYRNLMADLVARGETTGPNQSEDFARYTKMNHVRMERLEKTTELSEALLERVQQIDENYTFVVLTEAWCGDAAQNIPIFQKIVEANPHFKIRLVLRDENLELMDQHLTNGGRAIPKILVIRDQTEEVLTDWGPRPATAQQMVMEYKAIPEDRRKPYMEFVVEVQKWYNHDKTLETQQELVHLLDAHILKKS